MRKLYGYYREENCPFCNARATTKNKQGIAVCIKHKNENLSNIKCVCGEWLDIRTGKFGAYFNCMNCGNISLSKGLSMSPKVEKEKKVNIEKKKTETVVTSDMIDVYYS